MNTQQPEALRLADWLETADVTEIDKVMDKSAAELRRQHARITELEAQLAQRFDAADMATAAAQGFRDGAAKEQQAGWMPIETAPKDKTNVILLRQACGSVANGFWLAEAYAGNGSWIWPYVHKNPTHWIPAPPIASEAKGAGHA